MFNFNFDWGAIADFNTNFNPVAFQQEVAALANVATAAAVNSPAVVSTPANVAPAPAVVQPVVQQVVQSVAPVIAPSVPAVTLEQLVPVITQQVVSSPQVVASPENTTVSPKVVDSIVSSVGTAVSSNPEFVKTAVSAPATTTATTQTTPTITPKSETLKATESVKAAAPAPLATPAPTVPITSVSQSKLDALDSIEVRLAKEDAQVKANALNIVSPTEVKEVTTEQDIAEAKQAAELKRQADIAAAEAAKRAATTEAKQKLEAVNITSIPEAKQAAGVITTVGPAAATSGAVIPTTPTDGVTGGTVTPPPGTLTPPPGTVTNPNTTPPVTVKSAGAGEAGLAAVIAQLGSLGINTQELLAAMAEIRKLYPDIESADALTLLKYDKRFNSAYEKRFAGNVARAKMGLAPLDDKEYLANEAAYRKIFTAYGLNQFANPESYAKYIGTDLSPDEIGSRVSLVYNRVNNAPQEVMQAFDSFYPGVTKGDLMAYMLDPTNQLPELQKKVQAAEIGGEQLRQGLSTSLSAKALTGAQAAPYSNVARETIGVGAIQKENLTPAEMAAATKSVAKVLPEGEKLSSIYAGRTAAYGRKEAEQQYYQGLASAERAQQNLTELEKASFRAESGRARTGRGSVAGML